MPSTDFWIGLTLALVPPVMRSAEWITIKIREVRHV